MEPADDGDLNPIININNPTNDVKSDGEGNGTQAPTTLARPDPRRPARQSMIMSRPLPVIKIIVKMCFYQEDDDSKTETTRNDFEVNTTNSSSQKSQNQYSYEYTKLRMPAYSSVSLVKEAVIKFEPRFFSIEARQLAMSISSVHESISASSSFEANLDASFDKKLLIECHELIRKLYENNLPVFLVFWISSYPAPPKHSVQLLTDVKPSPSSGMSQSSEPKQEEAPLIDQLRYAAVEVPLIQKRPKSSISSPISSDISLDDNLHIGDMESISEEVEEELVLPESTALSSGLTAPVAENPERQKPQFVPTITSSVWTSSDNDYCDVDFGFGSRYGDTLAKSLSKATRAVLDSKRVTITDVLLKEKIWLKPDVLKEGWLNKRMKYSQKNEPRWFQLKLDHHLYYYKDPNDVTPLGKIPLAISRLDLPANNKVDAFVLSYTMKNGTRKVYLSSEVESDVLSWIEIINRITKDAKETYLSNLSLEGYLTKYGTHGIRTWKRRYCILRDGHLFYYVDAESAKLSTNLKGKISLEDCYVTSAIDAKEYERRDVGSNPKQTTDSTLAVSNFGPTTFKIHTISNTYLFMASTSDEMRQWIKAIDDERDRIKETSHLKASDLASHEEASSNNQKSSSSPAVKTQSRSNDFDQYQWTKLPRYTRNLEMVTRDIPIDDQVAEHLNLRLISSHMDIDQLRLIRYQYSKMRNLIIKKKAQLDIFDVLLAPLTNLCPSTKMPDYINIRFHFEESSVALKCSNESTIAAAISTAVELLKKRRLFQQQTQPDNFIVKICGLRQYILNTETRFCDVVYVREQISMQKSFVELLLQTKSHVIEEISTHLSQFCLDNDSESSSNTKSSEFEHSIQDTSASTSDNRQTSSPALESKKSRSTMKSIRSSVRNTVESLSSSFGSKKDSTTSQNNSNKSISYQDAVKVVTEDFFNIADIKNRSFCIRVSSLKNFSYEILDSIVPYTEVDNTKSENRISFFIEVCIFHGHKVVGEPLRTTKRLTPFFNHLLDFKLNYCQLAPEMRLGITLYVEYMSKDLPLAWVNVPVIDYMGRLKRGHVEAGMWIQPKQAHPVGSCEANFDRRLVLCLEFERPLLPLVFLDHETLPPLIESSSLVDRTEPFKGPYKSEVSGFKLTNQLKSSHPLLSENNIFGLETFFRIQNDMKPASIGSARMKSASSDSSNSSPSSTSEMPQRPPVPSMIISESIPVPAKQDNTSPSDAPSSATLSAIELSSVPGRSRKSYASSASPPPMAWANSQASKPTPIVQNRPTEVDASSFSVALNTSTSPNLSPSNGSKLPTQSSSPSSSITSNLSQSSSSIWSKTPTSSDTLQQAASKMPSNLSTPRLIAHLQEIDRICKLDPLTNLTETNKQLLWGYRRYLCEKTDTFPKLFLAADLLNPDHRRDLHKIVETAPLMPPEMALQLLDHKYPDYQVRKYAVRCLTAFGDEELASYLLQLVQVLQYESSYLSPLATFLVERAILNPLLIGHGLFWHLQSELFRPEIATKFGLLLEALLLGLKPSLRNEFIDQLDFVGRINELNEQLHGFPPASRTSHLRKQLPAVFASLYPSSNSNKNSANQQNRSGETTSQWTSASVSSGRHSGPRLVLPLGSAMVVKGLIVESCKVMDSAAFPLWLTFENEDQHAEPISLLFKFGDDLRQDSLTLQMFTIMDRLWKKDGLDMKMSLYKCLPTGYNMGMIEVVPNAETTARIQKEAGGIIGAFKQTPLNNWLKGNNPDPESWPEVLENFIRSCSAYCVATYVLGIGDRHNDNIMCTRSGKLFHIDFAHFLGNIIKFGVYKRERAPFVFTPEFAYVMGGENSPNYQRFKETCSRIYNTLRNYSNMFISLFELMIFAGLTQLTNHEDLNYLKKSLLTNASSEKEASDVFSKLIDESLKAKSTQLNFAIHIFAHPD